MLDDDPTGTQTVHDVPVLTVWDVDTLRAEFAQPGPCFYILTNSRSLPADAAGKLNREIARNLREAVWRTSGFHERAEHSRQLCCRAFTLSPAATRPCAGITRSKQTCWRRSLDRSMPRF